MIRELFCSENKLVRTLLPGSIIWNHLLMITSILYEEAGCKEISEHCVYSALFQLWKMVLVRILVYWKGI